MGGEPVGAHVRPIHQPALDHVPAEQPLEPAEDADGEHFGAEGTVERAPDQKPDEGHGEGDADDPPEQPVRVFQPENVLKFAEGHAPVDLLVLGEALVVGEERLPSLLAEGRQGADQAAASPRSRGRRGGGA